MSALLDGLVDGLLGSLKNQEGMEILLVSRASQVKDHLASEEEVMAFVDTLFDSYSAVPVHGRWFDEPEPTLAIVLINCCPTVRLWHRFSDKVLWLGMILGAEFGQEYILRISFPPGGPVAYTTIRTIFDRMGEPVSQELIHADGTRDALPEYLAQR